MGGTRHCADRVSSIKAHQGRAGGHTERDQTFQSSESPILFKTTDTVRTNQPHSDPLVISLFINEFDVAKILIDTGSTVDVIFKSTLDKMGIDILKLCSDPAPLIGLSGRTTMTLGTIRLNVQAGNVTKAVDFSIVDHPAIFNAIMGTPWINSMQAVPSTYHLCLKYPTPSGVRTLWGNQKESRACLLHEHRLRNSLSGHKIRRPILKQRRKSSIEEVRKQMFEFVLQLQAAEDLESQKLQNREGVIQVCIDACHPERCVEIGADLDEEIKEELISFLKENIGTFAWGAEDMPGISMDITSHELNVDPTFKPIKQKRRKLGPERAQAVNDEVKRLLKVGSIMEVRYPEWLANPVVVKKKNGKWRVCVDFTDINKACPKDSFPLPHIDRLVEATAGNELLSFMDAFSGYNQIMMNPEDREKTAFITDQGIYCYKVMPFGLKNAGATYQRLVNKMFADQLGKTMEVYIDDMLVKSLRKKDHVTHLRECFKQLNEHNMKLNPTKCRFAVTSGEFLGYLVTQRGIEANPKQIKALETMASPRT